MFRKITNPRTSSQAISNGHSIVFLIDGKLSLWGEKRLGGGFTLLLDEHDNIDDISTVVKAVHDDSKNKFTDIDGGWGYFTATTTEGKTIRWGISDGIIDPEDLNLTNRGGIIYTVNGEFKIDSSEVNLTPLERLYFRSGAQSSIDLLGKIKNVTCINSENDEKDDDEHQTDILILKGEDSPHCLMIYSSTRFPNMRTKVVKNTKDFLAVSVDDNNPHAIILQNEDNSLKLVEGGDKALGQLVDQFNDNLALTSTVKNAIKTFRGTP